MDYQDLSEDQIKDLKDSLIKTFTSQIKLAKDSAIKFMYNNKSRRQIIDDFIDYVQTIDNEDLIDLAQKLGVLHFDPEFSDKILLNTGFQSLKFLGNERPSFEIKSPKLIYDYLDQYVVGQERAKKLLSTAVYNHYKMLAYTGNFEMNKSNILMMGHTGCGKTYLVKTLAKFLDVPLVIADATEYTSSGYHGRDVNTMISELVYKTGGDISKAECGIIFIDEIDKLAMAEDPGKTGAGGRDIAGLGVQQELLKLLEGHEINVPLNVTHAFNHAQYVRVDSSKILFICAGAFVGLDKHLKSKSKHVGFNGHIARDYILFDAEEYNEAFSKYGLIPELLGRLPIKIKLHDLTEDDLYKILVEPKNAISKEYVERLKLDGVELKYNIDALKKISKYAYKTKVGARGLRSILELLLEDIMFEAPSSNIKKYVINGEFVDRKLHEN